ncbi:unnamed protein product [Adineta ricciae]|uniref:Glycosyltransferase family 92 protein n=1 Tax=Adineta ricciae TaxID=249248 RepID=A0A814KDJ7_ADIRI|nr:unnamed protein product [Adineta ricciae]
MIIYNDSLISNNNSIKVNLPSFPPVGWQPVGHNYEEQSRLRDISIVAAAWPETAEDNIPTVPCLSADGHLLVLSVAASRVRYGTSVTFMIVYSTDVKRVLPKTIPSDPIFPNKLSLWCIFSDGSVTPAYDYDQNYGNDRVSLIDCPLTSFASEELWKYKRTLRVYLASTTNKDRNIPILKAFVNVPKSSVDSRNTSQEFFVMCTSPLHNKADYIIQWIEFHRLVGFQKFVIYNTTDTNNRLLSIVNIYSKRNPGVVDIVQWNFSRLGLADVLSTRYFQVEALHDCLIRYGDQSHWLGMLDLDEYIVPLLPYKTIADYVHDTYGRRIIGSINLWSQFFCTNYTSVENNTNHLTIERFTYRAKDLFKSGREKYLYRPQFIQYLSIHHQVIGLSKQQPSNNHITLAHYASMNMLRSMPGCKVNEYVEDTSIRDRFANRTKTAIAVLMGRN